MGIVLPAGVVPIRSFTTDEILYGDRTTSYRFELLTHNPVTGNDSLIGFLDGVKLDGSLKWSSAASVKKSGTLNVLDLPIAGAGLIRIADIDIVSTRIRPVLVIVGLPDIPLGVYVITAAPESWVDTGRTFALELHDKCTVLDQDEVAGSFTADTATAALTILQTVIMSSGELITVDASDARTLSSPLVWAAGSSKLTIVNDLLNALNYNSLWTDGVGNFRATPYVTPANRPIQYTVLNDASGAALVRELTDGAASIYSPEWTRDRDVYGVPNKVVAVQSGTGAVVPLTGVATNVDPTSPFSYAARGRWITKTLAGVNTPAGDDPTVTAFLAATASRSLIASSAVQAAVAVKCLPIPVELLDSVIFASTPAGINARHTVQSVDMTLSFDGLMSLALQEVISL